MGTAPRKSSGSGPGKGGASSRPMPLTEMLAREGAPWRPFEDKGVLVKPLKMPRDARTIFAACEKQLVSHLKAVCLWPAKERNESWRVGDYSYYILEFSPSPKVGLYLQFWSEPDEDGAIFEVSSGAWNPPADKYVDTDRQELLRDHGFEIGGNANNFRKIVTIENMKDLRAIAREAVAIACKVLGYDGTLELRYDLHLQTHMSVRHVLSEVSPQTLEKMLHEWGFPADLKREEGKLPWIESRTDHGPFFVLFRDATKEESNDYHALRVRTFRKVKDAATAHVLANQLNQRLIELKATIDGEGDLMIESQVLLHAGVTAEHLRMRFELWRWMIGEMASRMES